MKNLTATKLYALAFGLFLGLCIWKFGNPVILDHKISAPTTLAEFLSEPWPLHWANWILLPLTMIGGLLVFKNRNLGHSEKLEIRNWKLKMKWLWLLPLAWLGWQFLSATQTVDADLTRATLWQFSGCVICYFLGALIFSRDHLWRWLLPDWSHEKNPGPRDIAKAAADLGVPYVLVTGIHLPDQHTENVLATAHTVMVSEKFERFDAIFSGAGDTLSAAVTAILSSGTDLESATHEALGYLDQSLNNGFRPGMGHVLPDRLFWAEADDEETDEDGEDHSLATAEDFSLPEHKTRH